MAENPRSPWHLDQDIWPFIMNQLPIRDVLRISRTCRFMHGIVQSYKSAVFSLTSVLRPFIEYEDVASLQEMMFQTRAIISGSIAFQFFTRTRYDSSDLDIYVPQGSFKQSADWFLAHGYDKLVPASGDSFLDDEEVDADGGNTPERYQSRDEIVKVHNFKKANSSKIVQLVSTNRDPIYAVLDFHSTCVMNFITHNHAYSLYPFSTLCNQETVVLCEMDRGTNQEALLKYENRGWKLVCDDPDILDGPSEIAARTRRIGDVHCWILELDQTQRQDHTPVHKQHIKWGLTIADEGSRLDIFE